MPFRSFAVKIIGVMIFVLAVVALAGLMSPFLLLAKPPQTAAPPNLRLPDESPGFDGIVKTLISAFDQVDILALGENHGLKLDSDVRIALVRHPDFARKVRSIVVECASIKQQPTLDRYIRGEDVPVSDLEQVWKTTTQVNNVCDTDFLAAVRDINSKLPADAGIRVLGGDPGAKSPLGPTNNRDDWAISVLKEQVLEKHGKALVIYGAAHFYRTEFDKTAGIGGITRRLEADYPGRTLVVDTVVGSGPAFEMFERALKTNVRPVLVSLQRPPFRDFTAEEFIGRLLMNSRGPNGCVSAFHDTGVTLGQLADACVFWRTAAEADTREQPPR